MSMMILLLLVLVLVRETVHGGRVPRRLRSPLGVDIEEKRGRLLSQGVIVPPSGSYKGTSILFVALFVPFCCGQSGSFFPPSLASPRVCRVFPSVIVW